MRGAGCAVGSRRAMQVEAELCAHAHDMHMPHMACSVQRAACSMDMGMGMGMGVGMGMPPQPMGGMGMGGGNPKPT